MASPFKDFACQSHVRSLSPGRQRREPQPKVPRPGFSLETRGAAPGLEAGAGSRGSALLRVARFPGPSALWRQFLRVSSGSRPSEKAVNPPGGGLGHPGRGNRSRRARSCTAVGAPGCSRPETLPSGRLPHGRPCTTPGGTAGAPPLPAPPRGGAKPAARGLERPQREAPPLRPVWCVCAPSAWVQRGKRWPKAGATLPASSLLSFRPEVERSHDPAVLPVTAEATRNGLVLFDETELLLRDSGPKTRVLQPPRVQGRP